MNTIDMKDLKNEMTLTDAELNHVKGGILIGLLLPAVQK